ncbi:MAG: hypothetical protein AB1410_05065 [Acidobacteriota bacterium]
MKESTLWAIQILTGLFLIFLLAIHMGLLHLEEIFSFVYHIIPGTEKPVDWSAVKQRGKEVSFLIIYILFLAFALYHGLYGLRNILIEAISRRKIERIITVLFIILGIFLFIYGTWATITIFRM